MRSFFAMAVTAMLLSGAGVAQENVRAGSGAVLRGLDKVDGDVVDLSLANGEAADLGRLSVEVRECRYPPGAISDAYAYLTVRDAQSQNAIFEGWMLASSPALNALEHPRYDVWVLRCKAE